MTSLLAPTDATIDSLTEDNTSSGQFIPSNYFPLPATSVAVPTSDSNITISPFSNGISPSRMSMNGNFHNLDPHGNRASPTSSDFNPSPSSFTNVDRLLPFREILRSVPSKELVPDRVRDILSPLILQNAKTRAEQTNEGKEDRAGVQLEKVKETLSDEVCNSIAAKMQLAQSQLQQRLRGNTLSSRSGPRKRSRSGLTLASSDVHNDDCQPHHDPPNVPSSGTPKAPRAMRNSLGVNGDFRHHRPMANDDSTYRRSRTLGSPSQASASADRRLRYDGDVTMGATPPAENHIMGREDSSAQRLDLLDDNAFQSNIESRDETKTEVGVELPVPLPPPLPVPGIWGFKIGLPKPDLLVFDFVVNEEIAIKWGLNSRSGDDNNAILGSGKPRLVLHLLCLPACEMLQAKLDEWQKTVVEPTLEARAHFIWTLQTPWPPQGSLIIEANKGKNCGKTILPQHLIGISALDITSNVQVGDNTFQLIQLTPMPHCFALHASMTEPQLDMACFSQFVEMQTNQAGSSSIIASTTVEVYPSIL